MPNDFTLQSFCNDAVILRCDTGMGVTDFSTAPHIAIQQQCRVCCVSKNGRSNFDIEHSNLTLIKKYPNDKNLKRFPRMDVS